ncbi:MAG: polysaccharide biosynthesis tyrosine autokinase [Candidatus Omnitrophica bacterium]|nr:polysaccharide biosynthesis tyrosine autokinase [Candidatus Omnitrophota bacterium]
MFDGLLNRRRGLIGQILLDAGLITHNELKKAIKISKEKGSLLGETLIRLNHISDTDLKIALQEQLSMSIVPIKKEDLDTPEATEFYRLHTNVKFALFSDDPIKSLMITSAVPKEGKSMTVAYFALVMANVMQKKTLLVDADMRHPSIDLQFGFRADHGLADLIVDSVTIDTCIHDTEIKNLKILPCGTKPPNPAALLASKKFKDIVEHLKERFDLILFDSAPVYPVADATLLSANVDAAILVIEAGSTRRGIVKRAVDSLKESNVKVLGAILNKVEAELTKYSYAGY